MWLYIPSASALVSEASNEDLNSRHLERLSQCCTASGKLAQPRSLQKRLREEVYQPLRSGLILRPSQAAQRLDTWIVLESTASQADTLVSRSQSPESNLAKTMQDTYGPQLLKRLSDIHQRCVSSRMSEGILFSDFSKSASVWNDWVTGLRQACSQRLKLVQDTDASGCSSWPTAGANDYRGTAKEGQRRGQLDEAAEQIWPTQSGAGVNAATTSSATPTGNMHGNATAPESNDIRSTHTEDGESFHSGRQDQGTIGQKSSNDGPNLPQQWATPNVPNRGPELSKSHRAKSGGIDLQSQVIHPDQQATTGGTSSSDGRNSHQQPAKRLNPLFVAWLMGYLESINCGPTETRSFHIVRQWLSSVCGRR